MKSISKAIKIGAVAALLTAMIAASVYLHLNKPMPTGFLIVENTELVLTSKLPKNEWLTIVKRDEGTDVIFESFMIGTFNKEGIMMFGAIIDNDCDSFLDKAFIGFGVVSLQDELFPMTPTTLPQPVAINADAIKDFKTLQSIFRRGKTLTIDEIREHISQFLEEPTEDLSV